MIKNRFIKYIVSVATGVSLVAGIILAIPVSAQSVGVNASTTVGTNQAARLAKIIARSDLEISARLTSLANLNTRIQAMKNVSATEKANISTQVQTNTSGLTSLKAKIDADIDATVALTDEKSIFGSYRIYALVIPQGYIEASSDRVGIITALMNNISAKLQARITAAQSAGKDVTSLQASLNDMNAKASDANSQAGIAESGVVNLIPDQGNTTVAASNKAALVAARGHIKTATSDLQTARQDAQSIIQALKSFKINVSSTSSAPVSH